MSGNHFLETARLILRKVHPADYDTYFRRYLTDREMDRLMCRSSCKTEEDALLSFDWFLNREERAYVLVFKETGHVVGNLTVYNTVPSVVADHRELVGKSGKALSFAMSPHWQRKGLMEEAVRAVIDHLFEAEMADYVNCGYLSFNTPSRQFQQKLGFSHLCTEEFTFDGKEITSVENILRKP